MLMPSQSPSSTITIQTLPSDQQQQQRQQEYVDTLNNQKHTTVIKFRREKSMEFDQDARFTSNTNDDINNNRSHFETTDELFKSASVHSSPVSSVDEDRHLSIQMSSSSPSPTYQIETEQPITVPSNRRSARPSSAYKAVADNGAVSLVNSTEPDPNVFLISSDTNSHNTIRKTKHDVKRFVMYIDEQFSEQKPLHTLSAESLCRYLKHYFENTKKFDGTQYEPDTLRSFLLSIERYLKSKKYEYNLMESPLFQSCRQVIITKREQWRKLGGGNHSNNHHHPPQSKSLLTLLHLKSLTIFDRTKPDGLLLEMYVHLTKLCQDKIPSLGQLLWGGIALIDEQYLVCQQQKPELQTIRLCATPTQPSTCPVQAYRLYATHRPPQSNTPQAPFFLTPRASNAHHIWYKTTGVGKNLEQILQNAIQRNILPKQYSSPSSIANLKVIEQPSPSSILNESLSPITSLNGKRNESRISSPSLLTSAKRIRSSPSLVQPINLSVASATSLIEDDSGTASSSPTNSVSNDLTTASSSLANKNSASLANIFPKQSSPSTGSPIWDERITDILLTVAKQRDARVTKINTLRTFLEEKLGVVEFLCLYRGFKSEPKLTFHGTPWEHYQRFLPVLFTLLALDNTTV